LVLAFHVYPKRRLTIVRASGSTSGAEWADLFGAIRRDPDYVPDGNWLIVPMDAEADIADVAAQVAAHLVQLGGGGSRWPKCGLVVSGTSRHRVGDPLALAGLNRRFATRTFMSEPAALAWIGWAVPTEAV
jgi:hypothetical protein